MVLCIVQARLSSKRFPGKVLADIAGKPMLSRVIDRVDKSKLINQIVVAVPKGDKELINLLGSKKYNPHDQRKTPGRIIGFSGSENDVLDRFYQATTALRYNPYTIVRITSDCPLIDPKVIDKTIGYFLSGGFDYANNRPSFPDGMDVEVFSYKALIKAWEQATSSYDREHVTTYFQDHPKLFKIGKLRRHRRKLPDLKWSVDELKDLEFAREVYERFGEDFTMEDILRI